MNGIKVISKKYNVSLMVNPEPARFFMRSMIILINHRNMAIDGNKKMKKLNV